MIHKQPSMPINAQPGDAWVHPKGEFKRVLSRGGAWENVNLGSTHPDEVDHEQVTQPEAQLGDDGTEVSSRTGESASGNGDDGQDADSADIREEDPGIVLTGFSEESQGAAQQLRDSELLASEPSGFQKTAEGEGVDATALPCSNGH